MYIVCCDLGVALGQIAPGLDNVGLCDVSFKFIVSGICVYHSRAFRY